MKMLLLSLPLLFLLPISEAVVTFKHSQLFDQFDLKGQTKVPLPCTNGCYVYASVRAQNATKFEEQVFFAGEDGKPLRTLQEIARSHINGDLEKTRFEFPKQTGSYYIMRNEGNLDAPEPVAIYVIDKGTAINIDTWTMQVFEPRTVKQITVNTKNVAFLGADFFTLKNFRLGMAPGRVRVIAAGPDVPLAGDADDCFALYDESLAIQVTADASIPMRSALVTVALQELMQIKVEIDPGAAHSSLADGTHFALSSPGFTGCAFATGLYRWNYPNSVAAPYVTRNRCSANVSITYDLRADQDSSLEIKTDTDDFSYKTTEQTTRFYDTVSMVVGWSDATNKGNYFGLRGTVNQPAVAGCTPATVPTVATSPVSNPPPGSSPLPPSGSSPLPPFPTSTKSAPTHLSFLQSLLVPFFIYCLIRN